MDFQASNLFISYKHLQAKTPEQLEEKMLQIQVSARISVEFTAPTWSNDQWHTWYLFDYSTSLRPKDKLKINNGEK